MESIFNIRFEKSPDFSTILSKYKGQVILMVNTATECGFAPQLKELELLYQKFKEKGFIILGFPSNDFGNQEPLENDKISQYCEVNFGVSFPFAEKSRVRGPYANPLFQFFADKKLNGKFSSVPRWNFQKYLVNRKGEVVDFYYPFTKPSSSRLSKAIQKLL
jgi:glutathione peroxidase